MFNMKSYNNLHLH